ncbi:RES family NAD+ phosphorylase [Chitinophaga sp. GbtcB8]|uniref:RES family NAD+ phosphorylase n=1 Tax=Chitinophaga sp. GbtcB8 TaxID=2824753 RepID=UPI001C30308C|nr:RES family NAD+ phosphorylase [Chitinophaga sp. GbtcB8]
MTVYRIVKTAERAQDLSGKGAYLAGGRWNSTGTFMLYTSESRSLALLENLVHYDQPELPPRLYTMEIEIADNAPIYTLSDDKLIEDWRLPETLALRRIGDQLFKDKKYLGFKVRSAVLPNEFNYLLDPLFPRYYDLVNVVNYEPLELDRRLFKPSEKDN